jgi:hypothetical protein
VFVGVRAAHLRLAALVAVPSIALAACGDEQRAAWCDAVDRRDAAFEADTLLEDDALAAFRDVEASAPNEIRDDLRTVREAMVVFATDAAAFLRDFPRVDEYGHARDRVDEYLRDECGLDIPERGGGS